MVIREEQASDIDNIYQINSDAFGRDAESKLVNVLRKNVESHISLVAQIGEDLVGHIMFTPVELTGCRDKLTIMGLAPLAILGKFQRSGVGSSLVNAGICRCREQGYGAIVVLGHPHYYPKFGFIPSVNFGITCEYDVSDDKFMTLELIEGSLKNVGGLIKYNEAFSNV